MKPTKNSTAMAGTLSTTEAVSVVERSGALAATDLMDLSVLIMARNERENLSALLPLLWKVVSELGLSAEVVVVDNSTDGTAEAVEELGGRAVAQQGRGYGQAFRQGLSEVRGRFVLTIDADHSHEPEFLYHMWAARNSADIIIGSRYVPAGRAEMPLSRRILSRILNVTFSRILALPYRDLSSGYRLYRREVIESVGELEGKDFDILEEILVKAFCNGWTMHEVPIYYRPRHQGRSNAQAMKFAVSYLRTLKRLWSLRNSALTCDYDSRAFNSWIPIQRYWQRRRFSIITELVRSHRRSLDIGCGASQIIQSLPSMIGMDVNISKLRYLKSFAPRLVQGSAYELPFGDESFTAVVSSQVIEHIPKADSLFTEMHRVLEPGGTLVLGTPDYATWQWNVIEYWYGKLLPNAYADEHISHYTRKELLETLDRFGFDLVSVHYIARAELILEARKRRDALPEERPSRA